jgi:hypothetical protein
MVQLRLNHGNRLRVIISRVGRHGHFGSAGRLFYGLDNKAMARSAEPGTSAGVTT